MKAALLLIFAACAITVAHSSTLTDQQKAKLKEYKDSCLAESGADKATIDKIMKGEKPVRDGKIDCFATCILKKVGVMRADGSVDVETARSKAAATNVDSKKANEVIDKCKDLSGAGCAKGGSIMECFLANKHFKVLD